MNKAQSHKNPEMMKIRSPFQKEISKNIISEYNEIKADERFDDLNQKLNGS